VQIDIDWDQYTQQLLDTIDRLRENNTKLCEAIYTLSGIIGSMWCEKYTPTYDKWEITCKNVND
jgi:hypothetical protein